MAVNFGKPPINEVVIGKSFEPLASLLIPFYGRYWSLIENEYPLCEHAIPVSDLGNFPFIDASVNAPLPRIFFLSRDRTRLLQLQTDRFYFNWRQTEAREEYIRFSRIFSEYKKREEMLRVFLAGQLNIEPRPRQLTITYVNAFDEGVEWSTIGDLSNFLGNLGPLTDSKVMGKLLHLGYKREYLMDDGFSRMRVSADPAVSKGTGKSAFRLELTATVDTRGRPDLDELQWFERAHNAIVEGFCEITSLDAQVKFWNKAS